MAAALRLFALVALILMPLSTAAPAIAHPASQATTANHCDERSARDETPLQGAMDCVAMCIALPAIGKVISESPLHACQRHLGALADLIAGFIPDVATPPPKAFRH